MPWQVEHEKYRSIEAKCNKGRKDEVKVVLMAGGRGTRISELFPDIPKPLIPIEIIPVLEREIISLRNQGFTDIIITIGYMAENIY